LAKKQVSPVIFERLEKQKSKEVKTDAPAEEVKGKDEKE